jgi:hypothetical protein
MLPNPESLARGLSGKNFRTVQNWAHSQIAFAKLLIPFVIPAKNAVVAAVYHAMKTAIASAMISALMR